MMSYVYDSLHPFQRTGAHFMRRYGSALLTDQPGLGKTIQTLGTIVATASTEDKAPCYCGQHPRIGGDPHTYADDHPTRWHLVVTPKVAISNVWVPEIARWLPDQATETLALTGTLAERQAALVAFVPRPETRHVFVIANIEAMRITPVEDTYPKSLRKTEILRFKGKNVRYAYHPENALIPAAFDRLWDTVVCDESHRALIRTSGVPSQTRAGFMLVRSRRRIALSGTPMRGKPEQLWGTLNWLRPDVYTSYWNWVKLYFQITRDRYSDFIVGGLTESGQSRLAQDLRTIMLRRTKAEAAPDLPPKTYAGAPIIPDDPESPLGIWLDMSPKQKRQYDRLVVDGLIGKTMVNGPLAEYTRMRQVAGGFCEVTENGEKATLRVSVKDSPKFDWLVAWLEQNEGEKVIVASQYTDTTLVPFEEGLKAAGYKTVSITGRTSGKNRDAAVDGFQNGSAQVCLLNVQAGGVALTLDRADYVVFLDESTIPDTDEQAEDRAHRVSRMHNVTIYKLRMLDTIEEEVAYIAAARQDVQRYLLDGARGVEYARSVYLTHRASAQPTESRSA